MKQSCCRCFLYYGSHMFCARMWVLSMGYSPSGMHCSSVSPLQGHTSCQKTCSYMATSQWATTPVRSLLWCGLSKGCGFLQSSSVGSLLLTSPMWLHILHKVIDRSMISAFVSHIGFGFCFFSFTLPFAVCSVFLPFSPVNYSHFPMCKGDF